MVACDMAYVLRRAGMEVLRGVRRPDDAGRQEHARPGKPLWAMFEGKRRRTPFYRFIRWCEERHAIEFTDYDGSRIRSASFSPPARPGSRNASPIPPAARRDIVHGRPIKNRDALADPDALKLYKKLAELDS